MITANDFNHYPMMKQAQMLFDLGKELMARKEGDYLVKLFSLSNFYVEAWYHPLVNRLVRVEVVSLQDVLGHYEPSIDISDLYQ